MSLFKYFFFNFIQNYFNTYRVCIKMFYILQLDLYILSNVTAEEHRFLYK